MGTVHFGYDGKGRRVRKTIGSTTTRYVYAAGKLVAEVDGGSPSTPLAEYTYYRGLFAGRLHSVRRRARPDSLFYYMEDARGNVVGLVTGTGSLVAPVA